MKSLVLIRCPLRKRQKYLGIFKASKKVLGEVFLTNVENAFIPDATFIHTSSFSKAQKVAKNLCETYGIDHDRMMCVHPNLQDYGPEDCIQILKKTPNSIETLVLIGPGYTMNSLYNFLPGRRTFFFPGSARLLKFPITDWSLIESHENENLI
jgi:hypothetical protein